MKKHNGGNMMNKLKSEDVLIALDLAIDAHKGQKRKGTDIPYIKHILDVYEILRNENIDNETLIIGILHDTVEDTTTTLEDIQWWFGDYVRFGVECESEDKTINNYFERKKEHIDRIKQAPINIQLVNCADKLANITDIIDDYNKIGEDVFKRFKQGKTGILKYYDYAILNYKLNGFETFEKLKEKFNLLKNMLEKVEKDNILC